MHLLFSIVFAFLVPIKPLILIVGAIIFLDTIFGITRAIKRKERITSNKLSRIVTKMVLYQSAIILFYCIEKFILNDIMISLFGFELLITKIIAMFLIGIETLSVVENYEGITGVNVWEKMKEVLTRTIEIKNNFKNLK